MSKIRKLRYTIDRFNQGCSFFQKAVINWKEGYFTQYEANLRKTATELIGAVEWILKIYLRNVCRDKITIEETLILKQPNFNDLIILMRKYASPTLDQESIDLLYHYRNIRNAAEHDAGVPSIEELYDAIQTIRQIIVKYLDRIVFIFFNL